MFAEQDAKYINTGFNKYLHTKLKILIPRRGENEMKFTLYKLVPQEKANFSI